MGCGAIESTRLLLNSAISNSNIGVGITDHLIQYYQFRVDSDAENYAKQESCGVLCHRVSTAKAPVYNVLVSMGADFHLMRFRNEEFKTETKKHRKQAMLCEIVVLHNSELDNRNQLTLPTSKSEWRMNLKMLQPKLSSAAKADAEFATRKIASKLLPDKPIPKGDLLVNAKLGSVSHEVGTLRMADDFNTGVVDTNLKVFGVKNLFVCDLSVFCSSPAANPSLTLAALALRLGDHLAGAGTN